MKRLCLNKLPPVLVIQLKRFEYDFEKVCAIKFNDYFEFPRDLDVEPYTGQILLSAILNYIDFLELTQNNLTPVPLFGQSTYVVRRKSCSISILFKKASHF